LSTASDHVPGEVLRAEVGAVLPPDDAAEGEAERDPDGAPRGRLAHAHDVRRAVGHEIHGEHREDDAEDGEPGPEGDVHAADLRLAGADARPMS